MSKTLKLVPEVRTPHMVVSVATVEQMVLIAERVKS